MTVTVGDSEIKKLIILMKKNNHLQPDTNSENQSGS
jgi:hypothetical protein